MTKFLPRRLALAGLLTLSMTGAAHAALFGDDAPIPTLDIAPPKIEMDVPMPVSGTDLKSLLSAIGKNHSLSQIKDAAIQNYRSYLQQELDTRLRAHFVDQQVPLVSREGMLSLHDQMKLKVIKNFSDLESGADYDLERGTVKIDGHFRYQLYNAAGSAVAAREVDLSGLHISEEYEMKSPRNGGAAKNTTESAIKLALSKMVDGIIDKIEDDLEADELRDLAAG
ncbi:hypothetical protein [Microbulbifer sp. SAOS-129_SWC]|uniref:hypothetical protein n=1 Tax=Microbulbifer sp. SAOS-129_SWC TaxID=3145235 RepID=UPI003217751D